MSILRESGEQCPIPPGPVLDMNLCQPCVYFRGASLLGPKWKIVCNWPRNGSETWKPLDKPLDDYTSEEILRMVKG